LLKLVRSQHGIQHRINSVCSTKTVASCQLVIGDQLVQVEKQLVQVENQLVQVERRIGSGRKPAVQVENQPVQVENKLGSGRKPVKPAGSGRKPVGSGRMRRKGQVECNA